MEKPKFKKKRTVWTKDCVCLSLRYQDWIPTIQQKIYLTNSKLGLKRLQFDLDGDGAHIEKTVINAFPKLSDAGSFRLLRVADRSKQLVDISKPLKMTVPYLKDIVGQAKLYVRPDEDIEVEEFTTEVFHIFIANYMVERTHAHNLSGPIVSSTIGQERKFQGPLCTYQCNALLPHIPAEVGGR